MDDMQLMRDFRAAVAPPDHAVLAGARARMLGPAPRSAPRPLRAPRRRHLAPGLGTMPRWRLAVPALAVAASAAVAATLLTGGHGAGHTATGPSAPIPAKLTARDVLLAAATAVATTPDAGTGRYWRQTIARGQLFATGPAASPYVTEILHGLSTYWWPVSSPGNLTWYNSQDYESRLPTPGATAAWRAAGSPPLPRQVGQPPEVIHQAFGLQFGEENLTLAQARALPTSPAQLRKAILKTWPTGRFIGNSPIGKPEYYGALSAGAENQYVEAAAVSLIQNAPVPPAVRAAALRLLAAIPGIRLKDRVTDPLGRTGYGITIPYKWGWVGGFGVGTKKGFNSATPEARIRLIISADGTVLANEDVTTVPTNRLSRETPASGAIPFTTCPAGVKVIGKECYLPGPVKYEVEDFTLGVPLLAVPAGTIVNYTVYLGSELTNDTPSAPSAAFPTVTPTPSSASSSAPS